MISFQPFYFSEKIEKNKLEYDTKINLFEELFSILGNLYKNNENFDSNSIDNLKEKLACLELNDNITNKIKDLNSEDLKINICQIQIAALLKQLKLNNSYQKNERDIIDEFIAINEDSRIHYQSAKGILYFEKTLAKCQKQSDILEQIKDKIRKENQKYVSKFQHSVKKGYIPPDITQNKIDKIIAMSKQGFLSTSHRNVRILQTKESLPILPSKNNRFTELQKILEDSINNIKMIPCVNENIIKCFENYKASVLEIFNNGNMKNPNFKRELFTKTMSTLIDNFDGKNESKIKEAINTLHFKVWGPDMVENKSRDDQYSKQTRRFTSYNPKKK